MIAVLAVGLTGCGKVPTWSELTSSTPPTPPATTPVPNVAHTNTLPQESPAATPPQRDPGQVLQWFKSLPPNQVSDDVLAQLTSLPTGLESITEVRAWGHGLTDRGLTQIGTLPALEILSLDGTAITNDGLKALQSLTNLQSLSLNGTKTSSAGFQYLAALPNLKRLDLMGTQMTPADFETVGKLPAIEALILDNVTELSDVGLDQLCNASSLKVLQLNGCNGLSDRGLLALAKVPGLEELYLARVNVTGVGFAAAASKGGLKHLKVLNVGNAPINLAGARAINKLRMLESLDISTIAGMNDAFFAEFVDGLKHLKSVNLDGAKGVLGIGFVKLKPMTSLETVNAQNTGISDSALAYFKGHKKLKFVDLSNTNVTANGVQQMKKALPNCEFLLGGIRY
ncbi:MAG: hypothetical protein JSS49_13415 [Planctomycetes bacterium]|nr:hypothetical protein [Planctomycetota bacterium]